MISSRPESEAVPNGIVIYDPVPGSHHPGALAWRRGASVFLHQRLRACDLQELADLRAELHARLIDIGCDEDLIQRASLVLTELSANALEHGCGGRENAFADVVVVFSPTAGLIRINDTGAGFDAASALSRIDRIRRAQEDSAESQPLECISLTERGRGIYLCKFLCEDLQYLEGGRAVVADLTTRVAAIAAPRPLPAA